MKQSYFNPQPKIDPVRSEKYKKFIRTKPCLACGTSANIQAAHENFGNGGMGTKVSDLWCAPLCSRCHRLEHHYGHNDFWENIAGVEDHTAYIAKRCLGYVNEFFANDGKL